MLDTHGNMYTVELHLSRSWLHGLAWPFWVNLSRVLQNYLALKLPVTRSSTVQRYGFWNFKSGVVERFRRRYMLYIVTAELQTADVACFRRKIQLSGFSVYPDGWASQLIRLS